LATIRANLRWASVTGSVSALRAAASGAAKSGRSIEKSPLAVNAKAHERPGSRAGSRPYPNNLKTAR
jgi:hypothetical protein